MPNRKNQSSYLFVYGFLMRENRKIPGLQVPEMSVTYVGKAYIHGKMFLISSFPGIVYDRQRRSRAYGEVYLINEWQQEFFKKMDEYELAEPGNPDPVYKRRLRPVKLSGKTLKCWIYESIRPEDQIRPIRSGSFRLILPGA